MYNVTVILSGKETVIPVQPGEKLSSALTAGGFAVPHPCGGHGLCGKCSLKVNGKSELSCSYTVNSDITVELENTEETVAVSAEADGGEADEKAFLALDIGSTTLALALVSSDGRIVATCTENNPQTAYGADVISRIEYCMKNDVGALQSCILSAVGEMTGRIMRENSVEKTEKMYVAGNMTMLHIFLGVNPSPMGTAPYTPVFLGERQVTGKSLGFDGIGTVITLPGFSAFVGADISAGLYYVGRPSAGKKTLLVDLGTNSEIALMSETETVCTSAAAGPCFEGANISCGMPARRGAVSHVNPRGIYSVIGDCEPEGLCATGLIDLVRYLLDTGKADETGYMEDDYCLSDDVCLTGADIRQFQLAKSAVYSAITVLLEKTGTSYTDIDRLCVAGGFSSEMNIGNAVAVGLFPAELKDKFIPVYNSSLLGTVRCGTEGTTSVVPQESRYLDMGSLPEFSEAFMNNMLFE